MRRTLHSSDPRKSVLLVGGGTGGPQLLASLRRVLPDSVRSIVVPVTDTGRSTGTARTALGIPAPGDLRHCLTTLAEPGNEWAPILERRLAAPADSQMDGMAIGNLVLGSLTQSEGSIGAAGAVLATLLGVHERVLPVSVEDIHLMATLEDGAQAVGELEVRRPSKPRIVNVEVVGATEGVWAPTREAIVEADIIVVGPGSLWTSIGAVLTVPGVRDAITQSEAQVIFVCNTTTQPGQTDGFNVTQHVEVVSRFLGRPPEFVVVNSQRPSVTEESALESEGLSLLLSPQTEVDELQERGIEVLRFPLLRAKDATPQLWDKTRTAYHDMDRTAEALGQIISAAL